LPANFFKKGLIANFFKKSLIKNASLFKKGLSEKLQGLLEFEDLILKTLSGVINRRNGFSATVADQP
jgi:hypothetical protein